MARRLLSDAGVAALKKKSKRYLVGDPEMPRHFVVVHPTGQKTFSIVVRSGGKQRWVSIGQADQMPIAEARDKARETIAKLQRAESATGTTFESAAESWFNRHVVGNNLRSRAETRRILDRYLLPFWKDRPMASIARRSRTSIRCSRTSTAPLRNAIAHARRCVTLRRWP